MDIVEIYKSTKNTWEKNLGKKKTQIFIKIKLVRNSFADGGYNMYGCYGGTNGKASSMEWFEKRAVKY